MELPYKIPQSVLVVMHTPAMEVLLIRRADTAEAFWQSVTGSKDFVDEAFKDTAIREVYEETGVDCSTGSVLAAHLCDWRLENVYSIYPRWLHRYAPGTCFNTEHVFGLCLPDAQAVRLNPREHTDYCWKPFREAASLCFSPSNAEAILMLPRFLEHGP